MSQIPITYVISRRYIIALSRLELLQRSGIIQKL